MSISLTTTDKVDLNSQSSENKKHKSSTEILVGKKYEDVFVNNSKTDLYPTHIIKTDSKTTEDILCNLKEIKKETQKTRVIKTDYETVESVLNNLNEISTVSSLCFNNKIDKNPEIYFSDISAYASEIKSKEWDKTHTRVSKDFERDLDQEKITRHRILSEINPLVHNNIFQNHYCDITKVKSEKRIKMLGIFIFTQNDKSKWYPVYPSFAISYKETPRGIEKELYHRNCDLHSTSQNIPEMEYGFSFKKIEIICKESATKYGMKVIKVNKEYKEKATCTLFILPIKK